MSFESAFGGAISLVSLFSEVFLFRLLSDPFSEDFSGVLDAVEIVLSKIF